MKKDSYLSKETSTCLKGISAIVVVLHHLYQYTDITKGTPIGDFLGASGALAVAVFLFFSGYGLMLSSKKEGYLQHFFSRRFLPLYCFHSILIVLFVLWTYLLGQSIAPTRIVQSFFFGETVITNGWYLQATFVLYLVYWVVFSAIKSPKKQIFAMFLFALLYCVFCNRIGLGNWWYQTMPCMVLGMIWAYKKEEIDTLLNNHAQIAFLVSSGSFTALYILHHYVFGHIAFIMLYCLCFVCGVMTLSYLLANTKLINNPFFKLCGNYSLEIYVSHSFFLRLIRLNIITDKYLYIAAVFAGTAFVSFALKLLYEKAIPLLFRKKTS